MKTPLVCCVSCFLQWMLSVTFMLAASGAMAEQQDNVRLHNQMQKLHEQMKHTQLDYEAQIDALGQRIVELEKVTNSDFGNKTPPITGVVDSAEHHLQPSSLQWSMSGLTAMGGSTASGDELKQLQAGSHDPRKNGFTIQALALAVHAKLDSHLDATASIVSHIEPNGESVVELEQAFIHAKELPYDLSVTGGQYFLNFGEENSLHPDDWDFVDVPFLLTRLFGGDKLRSQGIRLEWQLPLSWRSTLSLSANNPSGETATSFLYKKGEKVAGHVLQARDVEGPDDLLYLLKWSHQSHRNNLNHFGFGTSVLFGPNATGGSTDTQIYGLNFKWIRYDNSLSQQQLFNWRTELMYRRYEAGDNNDPSHEILKDYGLFSQAVWQLDNDWAFGLRAEFANGNKGNVNDPLRDSRKRFSMSVTHPFSKSIKWRLQYNRDWDDNLVGNSADSVWFQVIFQAGAHH